MEYTEPMKWLALALVIGALAADAQTASPNRVPALQPYQQKALENALRSPNAATSYRALLDPSTASPRRTVMIPAPSVSSAPREFATACVISLIRVPFDPGADNGIRRELKPNDLTADPMPAFKGLPVCDPDR
jgi:hypothetical protein